jgi:hypothetical protein
LPTADLGSTLRHRDESVPRDKFERLCQHNDSKMLSTKNDLRRKSGFLSYIVELMLATDDLQQRPIPLTLPTSK